MNYKLVLVFSIIFLVLDLLWISYFGLMFNPMIGNIQGSVVNINYYGAILAYVVLIFSYLVIAYNGDKPDYLKGLVLGFAIYGTFEFTNLTVFSKWNLTVLFMDIMWGLFVSVMSLFLTDIVYTRIK